MTLVNSSKDKNDIKIIKPQENLAVFFNGISKIVKNNIKELEDGFLSMLLVTLEALILANLLSGKRLKRVEKEVMIRGKELKHQEIL